MVQQNAKYNKRLANDEEERLFWKKYVRQKPDYAPDTYSVKVCDAVCALVKSADARSVLEIGPGWGNYTMRLAQLVEDYACIDISEDILDYLMRIARDKGINNITALCAKWEDAETRRYDAVFAYNCFYRMSNVEHSLKKIDDSAGKLCVVGMNSSPEQPYLTALEEELGLMLCYTRLDCRILERIVWQMGIKVEFKSIPNDREYEYDDFESLFAGAARYIRQPFDEQKVSDVLLRYYRFENGKYRCSHKFTSDLTYWYK